MARLNQKFLNFNTELESMDVYLTTENRARLGVTDEVYDLFKSNLHKWTAAYILYTDPDRGTSTVLAINLIYKEALSFVRRFRGWIKSGNGLIFTLTGEDYENLYIHRDKQTHTPSERPIHAPVIVVLKTHHLEVQFEVRKPLNQDINRLALPSGLKLSRKLAVTGPVDALPQPNDYRPIDHVGHGRFTLTFAPADEGNVGYIICTYFNRLGQHGPESPPLKFYII